MKAAVAKKLIGRVVINRVPGRRAHMSYRPCRLVAVDEARGVAEIKPQGGHGHNEIVPLKSIKRWRKGEHRDREMGIG